MTTFAYVCKSANVYAFTRLCKMYTYANVGNFASGSDQVQIRHFAYMQICSSERKAEFAHTSIYPIVLNKG